MLGLQLADPMKKRLGIAPTHDHTHQLTIFPTVYLHRAIQSVLIEPLVHACCRYIKLEPVLSDGPIAVLQAYVSLEVTPIRNTFAESGMVIFLETSVLVAA